LPRTHLRYNPSRKTRWGPLNLALVVGTEAVFGYIQAWALRARRAGALLVEVNPSETPLSAVADVRLSGKAGEILPEL